MNVYLGQSQPKKLALQLSLQISLCLWYIDKQME